MLIKISRAPLSLPLRLQLHVRHLSSTPEPALQAWIQQMTSAPAKTTTDLIDLERAQQLCRVLPTRTGKSQVLPEWGTALGKGHHLAYFWPKNENEHLGEDGSSRASLAATSRMPPNLPKTQQDYNAPAPYSRRMWAGGSFEWPSPDPTTQEPQGLLVGSSISEQTSVQKIEAKSGMVFVHQLKEYKAMGGRASLLKEIRMHVFRPSLERNAIIDATELKPSSKSRVPASIHR